MYYTVETSKSFNQASTDLEVAVLGHGFGVLPFLLLLACPLMHVFMHRGHGKHGGEQGSNTSVEPRTPGAGEQP